MSLGNCFRAKTKLQPAPSSKYAMSDHVHQHFLTRHSARGAVRKREVDLPNQVAAMKRRYVVDILPIAAPDVSRQIFQGRHLA
jgi:hypothetical protein